jgi:uncharacterized protein YlxW (UPF0749 family)
MSVTPSDDEEGTPTRANSLPPVVPEDEPDRENSLPPVVPDDDADRVNSLPPVVPEDEPVREDSRPTAVPQGDPAETHAPAGPASDDRPTHLIPTVVADDGPADEVTPEPEESLEDGHPAEPGPVGEPPSGWAVLGRALSPRPSRAQVVAGILCAVLGFAVVAQVRQSGEADLGGMRQGDLVRILDETTNRGDALARESADLARERDDLLSGSDRRQAALDALRRSAETQGILTGRLPAEGPGVTVTLTEPEGFIKPITMLNLLEELRNAGAEAVQLNDQRITASSAFTGTGGAVVLDGVPLTAPYRWIAIGDPDIIAPALQIPGGAMAQVRNNGGKGTVESADHVSVDAIRVVPDPVYATPVAPPGV